MGSWSPTLTSGRDGSGADALGVGVDVEPVVAHEADDGHAEAAPAASTARIDGALTAQTTGMPATAAFWTISKRRAARDLQDRDSARGTRAREQLLADHLVDRVVAPDVLADG